MKVLAGRDLAAYSVLRCLAVEPRPMPPVWDIAVAVAWESDAALNRMMREDERS